MFKKALVHQSNATPIRSSACRQLLNRILDQYPALRPPTHEDPEASSSHDQNAKAGSSKELGKVILPDGVKSGTFETSQGVEGTFYLAPSGDALWMTFGRSSTECVPTLSLLALELPRPPLPVLQIHHPVPPPILTGAPLFLPAVRNLGSPHLVPEVSEGGLVAFVVSERNEREVSYLGVGRVVARGGTRGAVERRIKNIQERKDVDEGKFCEILCIVGDHLWELGSKPTLPTFTLPQPETPLAPPPGAKSTSTADAVEEPVNGHHSIDETATAMQHLEVTDNPPTAAANLSTSDVSTLLSLALLQVLSSEEQLSFPMPASLLYSAHVLPNRPAYIAKDQREEVVIARSTWKKLSKWMKEAGKDGLLKVKEVKGEVVVQGFDASHPSVQTHKPFMTVGREEAKEAKKAARDTENGVTEGAKGKGKAVLIEELWKPTGGSTAFWQSIGADSDFQPSLRLKQLFDDYVKKTTTVGTTDHRVILLTDDLAKAMGIKSPQPGQTALREEVLKKLREHVSWGYSLDGKVKKGTLQPVTMVVKTRQGRKTVTLISGLETFGIDIDDFAEELKKLCAGSASIQPLQGASPKLNLQEIMVQGSQVRLVTEALLAKGVPRKWIKEAEGDKKRK